MTTLTDPVVSTGTPEGTPITGTPAVADGSPAVVGIANPAAKDTPGDKAPDGNKAVEYTDFTLPEGMTLDTEVSGKFKEWAKGKGLTQAEAQGLVDMQTQIANKQMDAWGKKLEEWKQSAASDPRFGGAAFKENVAVAQKALDSFGSPELKELLVTSGMGNNPEVINFFYNVGKAVSSDKIMGAGQAGSATRDAAKTMYPNMA